MCLLTRLFEERRAASCINEPQSSLLHRYRPVCSIKSTFQCFVDWQCMYKYILLYILYYCFSTHPNYPSSKLKYLFCYQVEKSICLGNVVSLNHEWCERTTYTKPATPVSPLFCCHSNRKHLISSFNSAEAPAVHVTPEHTQQQLVWLASRRQDTPVRSAGQKSVQLSELLHVPPGTCSPSLIIFMNRFHAQEKAEIKLILRDTSCMVVKPFQGLWNQLTANSVSSLVY